MANKKRTAEALRREALKHLNRTVTLVTLGRKLGHPGSGTTAEAAARRVIDDLRRHGYNIESFGKGRFARGN